MKLLSTLAVQSVLAEIQSHWRRQENGIEGRTTTSWALVRRYGPSQKSNVTFCSHSRTQTESFHSHRPIFQKGFQLKVIQYLPWHNIKQFYPMWHVRIKHKTQLLYHLDPNCFTITRQRSFWFLSFSLSLCLSIVHKDTGWSPPPGRSSSTDSPQIRLGGRAGGLEDCLLTPHQTISPKAFVWHSANQLFFLGVTDSGGV